MTDAQFIEMVRTVQATVGPKIIEATLAKPYKGVRYVDIDASGEANRNPHDLWIRARCSGRTIGRAYLGSDNLPQNLEGWPERIAGEWPNRAYRPGFYGSAAETVLVDRGGAIWLVQSPDTNRFERLSSMPAGLEPLPESVCGDLQIPAEANW